MNCIDINCDLGENYQDMIRTNDEALMPWVSSCNIACGFHGGDPLTMVNALALARKYDVKVGAHPSYPDRKNFGRVKMDLEEEVLCNYVIHQLNTLSEVAASSGLELHHVKPHGALYNAAFDDALVARAIVDAVLEVDARLALYCQPNSELERIGKSVGIDTKAEGFGDRSYQANGRLTPRSETNAIWHQPEQVNQQVLQMVNEKSVEALDGHIIPMDVATICIHGDHKNSVNILQELDAFLKANNIKKGFQ
ncbi:MAG: LamB/YcsF family protein [Saprospiraceae bacterium]|nr:LamB/YcsF family protein [Saprospiraceae bacterium]